MLFYRGELKIKIFIDTADLDEIREAYSWGIIDGVTTNPSLMKKAVDKLNKKGKKISLEKYIQEILKTAKKTPVSLEVTTLDYDSMVKEGKNLYKKFKKYGNVYIKIPIDPCLENVCSKDFDGIKAIRTLSKEKIPINCTLIFSPEQALLASKAGAKMVSPFAGREDDFIREKAHIKFDKKDYFSAFGINSSKGKVNDNGILSGIDLIKGCVDILRKNKRRTEVLAASIRNPRQLREAAEVEADIATVPFSILKEAIKHVKTIEGMQKFTKDVVPEYRKISLNPIKIISKKKK